MFQRYKKYRYNKKTKRMARIYLPMEITSKLTYSSQTILYYVISNISTKNDDSYKLGDVESTKEYFTYKEDKDIDYISSQTVELHWKVFVDNKILSKAKFYQGLKELIDLDLIVDRSYLNKNCYLVNYYYIDAMSYKQYERFKSHMTNCESKLAEGIFPALSIDNSLPLVNRDRLNTKTGGRRDFSV